MTCEDARRHYSLLLYGELNFDGEEELEQHLTECDACRHGLEAEKRMHHAMESCVMTPTADLLLRCRSGLRAEMGRALRTPPAQERDSWWRRARMWMGYGWGAPALLRPAGALALIAIGFIAARLIQAPPAVVAPANGTEPIMTRVRNVEPDASGGVRVMVEETRQRVMSGRPEEDAIRRLLLAAVRDPADPGLRVETMDILKRRPESADVRRALLYAVQHDPNAGVRLKALEGLKPFAAEVETRKALSQVLLADDNPGVRTQAIDLLIQTKEQDVVGVLQELLRREDNGYVRMRSQKALREMGASVETF